MSIRSPPVVSFVVYNYPVRSETSLLRDDSKTYNVSLYKSKTLTCYSQAPLGFREGHYEALRHFIVDCERLPTYQPHPCQSLTTSFQDVPLKRLRTLSLDEPYKTSPRFDRVKGQRVKGFNGYFFVLKKRTPK